MNFIHISFERFIYKTSWYPSFKKICFIKSNSVYNLVQLEHIQKHLYAIVYTVPNLKVDGKKLLKCVQTPLKVSLQYTEVVNVLSP